MNRETLRTLPQEVLTAKLKELQRNFDSENGDLVEIHRDFARTRAELIRRGASEREIEWAIAPSMA